MNDSKKMYYYITTYDCTMELFTCHKGLNVNLIESVIPLNDDLMLKHQLMPIKQSVVHSNAKQETFRDEESYIKRVKELYNELNDKTSLEEFIKRNKVSIPVTILRYAHLGVNWAHKAREAIGEVCPKCKQETVYCTYWAVGMNDPGQRFTHACFSCLEVLKAYDTDNMDEEKCPYCGWNWAKEFKS